MKASAATNVGAQGGVSSFAARLERFCRLRREHAERPRIKINLYRGYEAEAAAAALADLGLTGEGGVCDCLMIANSYLTTHLGRTTTRLSRADEQATLLRTLVELIGEVAAAARANFRDEAWRPFILGDMPDGSFATADKALASASAMMAQGAEAVKVEVPDDGLFAVVAALARNGIPVLVHLGYAPQRGENRLYAGSLAEAELLFARARRARDVGASALVLERVAEPVHARLAWPDARALPTYAIFSGRCAYAGQNLNVWDAVFMPEFAAQAFPPTARYRRSEYPAAYTPEVIREHLRDLVRLTMENRYPKHQRAVFSAEDIARLGELQVWTSTP